MGWVFGESNQCFKAKYRHDRLRTMKSLLTYLCCATLLCCAPMTQAQKAIAAPVSPSSSPALARTTQTTYTEGAKALCQDYDRQANESVAAQTARLLAMLTPLESQNLDNSKSAQQTKDDPPTPSPCWSSPDFLAQLGHLLIIQGLYIDALDYLERAVMLDPSLKSAQVDYALALSGSGDAPSGAAMLKQLLGDPSLPVELAPSLLAAKSIFSDGAWRSKGLAGLTLGYDSNLLGAPNLGNLALTVSGQTVVLPLAPGYQAKAGGYSQGDMQYEAQKVDLEGNRYDVYASARQRYVPIDSNGNYTQLNVVGEYGRSVGWGQAYVNASVNSYQSYVESLYSAPGVGFGGIMPLSGSCTARLGVNGALRRYNTNSILSGNYLGLQSIIGCPDPVYWQLIAGWGVDNPVNTQRPGGAQRQTTLRALTILPAGPGQLLLDAQLAYYIDTNGYSNLLESDRLRSISQYSLKGEYQYALNRSWQLVGGYNWVNQISTLSLFGFNSSGPYLALRFGW